MKNIVRKGLRDYINKDIKNLYKTFDKAHSISHFNFVTNNCLVYGKRLQEKGMDIDLEIAYVVGALHDIGIAKGREGHARSSGEMVRKDKELSKFFETDQIELIAQAVEDHSSHLEYEPRSIYGKIVADADRNNTMYLVFSRPIKFEIKNGEKGDRESYIDRVYSFVQKKFGRHGYVKYWLDIPETTKEQEKIWTLLDDKEKCKQYIAGIFDEVTKGKFN